MNIKKPEYYNFINKNIILMSPPIGYFFNELEKLLISQKNQVFRINLNGGEEFFSNSKNDINFVEDLDIWKDFIEDFILIHNIDIIIMTGDLKKYNFFAKKAIKEAGGEVYIFDLGYFRPNFITFERNSINYNSKTIPKNISIYKKMNFKNKFIDNYRIIDKKINHRNFFTYYYSFIFLLFVFFKKRKYKYFNKNTFYKYSLLYNIYGFSKGFFLKKRKIPEGIKDYFLIPLQLKNDTQIIFYSKYNNMEEFIEEVCESFSKSLNSHSTLVFKQHPLEVGFVDYSNFLKEMEHKYNLIGRLNYINIGNIDTLIKKSNGVITINSTVGFRTLALKKPLKVFGKAIYDIEGITFKEMSLNKFFIFEKTINEELVDNFLNYVLYNTQIHGSFQVKKSIIKN